MTGSAGTSFAKGFLTAAILFGAVWLWNASEMSGGIVGESPDRRYRLLVWGPMEPTQGGTYDLRLIDINSGTDVRRFTMTVPWTEETVSLREGGGAVTWDASSRFADITIGGRETLRVWAP